MQQISDGRVFVEGETYILINMGPCLELIPDEGNFYNCVKGGAGPIPGIKELISPPDKWGNIGKEDIVTRRVKRERTRFMMLKLTSGTQCSAGLEAQWWTKRLCLATTIKACRWSRHTLRIDV